MYRWETLSAWKYIDLSLCIFLKLIELNKREKLLIFKENIFVQLILNNTYYLKDTLFQIIES